MPGNRGRGLEGHREGPTHKLAGVLRQDRKDLLGRHAALFGQARAVNGQANLLRGLGTLFWRGALENGADDRLPQTHRRPAFDGSPKPTYDVINVASGLTKIYRQPDCDSWE